MKKLKRIQSKEKYDKKIDMEKIKNLEECIIDVRTDEDIRLIPSTNLGIDPDKPYMGIFTESEVIELKQKYEKFKLKTQRELDQWKTFVEDNQKSFETLYQTKKENTEEWNEILKKTTPLEKTLANLLLESTLKIRNEPYFQTIKKTKQWIENRFGNYYLNQSVELFENGEYEIHIFIDKL